MSRTHDQPDDPHTYPGTDTLRNKGSLDDLRRSVR